MKTATKKTTYLFLVFIFMIGFNASAQFGGGCTLNSFSPSSLVFNHSGGTKTMSISYSGPVCIEFLSFTNTPSWLTISQNNVNSISITCQNNPNNVGRNLNINYTYDGNPGSFNVTQTATPTFWFYDGDGDGYGDANVSLSDTSQPSGYVSNSNDYDDSTVNITNIAPQHFYKDGDGDSYGNPSISVHYSVKPATYVTNNSDYDDTTNKITNIAPQNFYKDADGDGYGNPSISVYYSVRPSTYVSNNSDYNDNTANITNIAPQTFYKDADGDGYGNSSISVYYSVRPATYVSNNSDYNDSTSNITNIAPQTFYKDADGDGYGNPSISVYYSVAPATYISNNSDYNDSTSNITNIAPQTFYKDADGDGFGDPNDSLYYSVMPAGYVIDNTDVCPAIFGTNNGCKYLAPTLSDENYIYTQTFQKPITTAAGITEDSDVIESITYFDGLGRTKQQIGIKQSPNKTDLISHISYDALGRQDKEWLPYAPTTAGAEGSFRANNQETAITTYYTSHFGNDLGSTPNPYSQKAFDSSPLNRILEQAAPGESWEIGATINPNGYSDGHTIKFDYQYNVVNEVLLFNVTLDIGYNPTLTNASNSYYGINELYKTITKDENWTVGKNHTTEEFKDKQGRVILKRTYANINSISTAHDTYYVYDDYGNLTYVLPPKVNLTDGVSVDELTNLAYQYQYDNQNRLVEKQIPGKGREYIVYDNLDRPVLTKDALNDWLFTKYDVFGRVVYTGKFISAQTREQLQQVFDNKQGTPEANYETKVTTGTGYNNSYYTNSNFPDLNIEILTVNYYDDYSFDRDGAPTSVVSFGVNSTSNTKSLATGSKVKVLETTNWITSVSYYDEKARNIYSYSKNDYLETADIVELSLDFVGKILQTRTQHIKAGTAIATLDNFTYDHVGRLLSQTQCIGNEALGYTCPESGTVVADLPPLTGTIATTTNAKATKSIVLLPNFRAVASPTVSFTAKIVSNAKQELIVSNTYDKLGQLESKKVGNTETNPLQVVTYNYNIRGWLRGINDIANTNKLFNFKLDYNTGSGVHLYNGNISATSWRTANTDSGPKSYVYSYDALNRITAATGANSFSNYDVSGISYDKMGNILSLNRKGHTNVAATTFGDMDLLSYSYDSGNQLQAVDDDSLASVITGFKDGAELTTEYTYDANGNMIVDKNKGISAITYNHLNLPTQVTIANTEHNGNIQYVYDATGVKQRKIVSDGATIDYSGNYVYEKPKNGTTVTLQFFNHPEGYVNNNNGAFEYIYQYKDHLGNVRLSYQDADNNGVIDAATEIIDEKNYYPFGLAHRGYNNYYSSLGSPTAKKFGFNGIELEEGLGLDMYEMDVRSYDSSIARWTSIDPVTHHSKSTYNAFDNNPIYWTDPSGANSVQDLVNQMNRGVTYTNNGNGTFTGDGHTVGEKTDPPNKYEQYFAAVSKQYEGAESGNLINPNFGNGGAMGTYNGAVRVGYALASYRLKPLYNSTVSTNWQLGMDSRYRFKSIARNLTSPVWRRLLNLSYPVSSLIVPEGATKPPVRFFKTHGGWNMAGGASLTMGVFGLGVSGYNIYNADNKLEQSAIEGGSWAGAWFGAELGGAFASSHFPHPLYVGAWSIVGGVSGGIIGRSGMERAAKNSENVNFSELDKSMKNCKGNVCFGKGTKVVMSTNELKNIETIEEGDFVLSYNTIKNIFIKSKVLNVSKNMVSQHIILSLKNGVKVKVTNGHYILTRDNGYIMSHTIKKGDFLAREKNGKLKFIEVSEIRNSKSVLKVFNLRTSKNNFLVTKNGIIVLDNTPLEKSKQ